MVRQLIPRMLPLSFLVMVSLALSSPVQDPELVYVSMPDISAYPGAEVAIGVFIDGIEPSDMVFSYQLDLSFDPDILVLDSVSREGTITLTWGSPEVNYDSAGGTVRLAAGSSSTLPQGDGVLIYLCCRVLATATPGAVTNLHFDQVMFNEGSPAATHFDGSLSVLKPARFDVSPTSLNMGIISPGQTDSAVFEIVNNTPQSLVVIESLSVAHPAMTLGPIALPDTLENPGDSSRSFTVLCSPVSEDLISEQIGIYSSTGFFVSADILANSDYDLFWETLAKTVGLQPIQQDVVDLLDEKGNHNTQADIGDLLVILKGKQPVRSLKTTPADMFHEGTGGVR